MDTEKITEIKYKNLTREIIGAAIDVHNEIGPGLMESVYEKCLCYEFGLRNIQFLRQQKVPVRYKEIYIEEGYRADLVVNQKVIVEIKSVDKIEPIHDAQVLTYMKLLSINVGLLINFKEIKLKNGIKRYVL